MTRIINSLAEISAPYDAAFVDLWGCVHDGMRALPEAVAALQTYRAEGGRVVLVTNAPRPWPEVEHQIARLGVPEDAWDAIATSGDSARMAMYQGAVGTAVHFIGEPHDRESFFVPPRILSDPLPIEIVPLDRAEGIVCTGPVDSLADPAVNRPAFLLGVTRGLKLLCANPDIVVDRGESREWCAGALAQLYSEMGGESLYFGKPHPPIYDLARRRLSEVADVADDRILCIGDGIATDVAGAMGEGLDCVFITGGLARAETGTDRQPDPAKLEAYLQGRSTAATFAMGYLR